MLRACGVQRGVAFGNKRACSCKSSCQQHKNNKRGVRAQQGESSGAEGSSSGRPNALTATVKRKQKQLADLIQELGMETLEERLQSGTASPARPPHRFVQLIQDSIPQGKAVMVAEVCRPSPASTSADVAALAAQYVAWGADAVAVCTDLEETPAGLSDLFAVCRAVRVPVLQTDWFLHPLQLVEAKEAGAAGVIGIVANILGNGSPVMSSFAAAIGLDAPIEIVNQTEISRLEQTGVPFFGINLSVGLSLALPGFQKDMAKGLLGKMPFGVVTLVGARSAPDARQARLAGADAVLLKRDMLCNGANSKQDVQQMMMQLSYSFSGDD